MADLTARSIIEFGEVMKFLKKLESDPVVDKIATWIDLASGEIERRTNRKIVAQEVVCIMDGSGTDVLMVPYVPVKALTFTPSTGTAADAVLSREADGSGAWAKLIATEDAALIHVPDSGWGIQLLAGNAFPMGNQNIKVSYVAGWERGAIPGDLQRVCLEMTLKMYNDSNEGSGNFGKSNLGLSVAGGSTSGGGVDFEERWDKILTRYRVRRFQ